MDLPSLCPGPLVLAGQKRVTREVAKGGLFSRIFADFGPESGPSADGQEALPGSEGPLLLSL